MNELLEQVYSMSNIDEIIDLVSNELKKPIVLESDHFFLLAYNSYYINQFDVANQQTIFSKKCPLEIFEKFVETGIIDQLKTNPVPFRVKQIKEIGLNQRVVVSAKHKDNIMGYIWVQEIENVLTDEELAFLFDVSFHLGKLIDKMNQLKHQKEEKIEQLFRGAIHNHYKTEKEIKWEAENINIVLPSVFSVLVLNAVYAEKDLIEELKETISSYLNLKDKVSHAFVDQSNIVIILGCFSKKISTSSAAMDLVENLLTHFNTKRFSDIFIGIGNEYEHLLSLRQSYLEALEVLKVAELVDSQENVPYEYSKLGVFRYLNVIDQKNKQTQYINSNLRILIEKDKENQSELLKTLEIYLFNNCKLKSTAEQMFIHLNTLNYRLKQITELTTIDFGDFNMKCQLFIDIMLLKKS
ncbi:PucR family transcriptional regulator [Metabacillus herbersteinensis]|uniref:PucR family transcriptional regulator n=1 Tax=Metabacillus herbersteinensis TaxID=283816 RepID=A0ABV6GJW8_9BACI